MLAQCGELESATQRVESALQLAHEIDHPYSLAYALYHNGFLAFLRERFDECLGLAKQLASVADENDYPVWRTLATVLEGVSTTGLGRPEEGLVLTEAGVDLYQGLSAPPVFWPLILSLRTWVHAMAGMPEVALGLIDEAIELGPDGYPEFKMIRANVLRMLPDRDPEEIEGCYQAAIEASRLVGARLTELQTMTHLVAFRRSRGQDPDASTELSALYETFTEGFDELPVRAAREVLDLTAS